jgi:hypothetical protein
VNPDFVELIIGLLRVQARFLIVGAHALAVHGVSRGTGDIDIWIERSPENAARVWAALVDFGAPVASMGISVSELQQPETVIQIGVPPRRIDILTDLSGIDFAEAWEGRVVHTLQDIAIPFLGRIAFVQNKRATGRLTDLADLEALGESLTE